MANGSMRRYAQLGALMLCFGLGCTPSTIVVVGKPLQATEANLSKIGIAYLRFTREMNRPPKDIEELKPLLRESGDPDAMLLSDRDHQPLVVCCGVDTRQPLAWAKSPPVLGYEKRGVNGSRYVLTVAMGPVVRLMPQEQFLQASFPPGQTPNP